MDSAEKGTLLETYFLHELKAHIASRGVGGEFYYWGTHGGIEADFVWVRGKSAIGFEIRSSERWRSEYSDALRTLLEAGRIKKAYGIYLGKETLSDNGVLVLPFMKFMDKLNKNEIF